MESRAQLVEYMESGNKPESQWRLGTEHEKFGYSCSDNSPLPYEGTCSVRAILEGLVQNYEWQPILEHGKTMPPGFANAARLIDALHCQGPE